MIADLMEAANGMEPATDQFTMVELIVCCSTLPYVLFFAGLILPVFSSKIAAFICKEAPDLSKADQDTPKLAEAKASAAAPMLAEAKVAATMAAPAPSPGSEEAAQSAPDTGAPAATPPPKLWRIGDNFYDLTEFIPKHPGGALVLEQAAGTEISALFHSHHLTEKPEKVLAQYRVQDVPPEAASAIPPCDYSFEEDGFFRTLKRRVIAMNLSRPTKVTAGYELKAWATMAAFLATWACICFLPMTRMLCAVATFNMILRAMVLGFAHEAIHGRLQNWLTFELLDMMVLFPSKHWHHDHVIGHHPHTKRYEHDPDEILGLFRLCRSTPWMQHHVIQAPLQLITIFASPFVFFEKHILTTQCPLRGAFYLVTLHFLPLLTRASLREALLLMFLSVGMGNAFIVFSFHLSHINENNADHADFKVGGDWGAHQISVSSNFRSSLTNLWHLTGMLDLQIEHHLFPSLSYLNQQRIKPVVQETAKEFNLPYYEFPTAFHGISAHCYTMHKNGWRPKV